MATSEQQPSAFASYASLSISENDRLAELIGRLEAEVRMQTGDAFRIFLDRRDIGEAEKWTEQIDRALNSATLFIPIITPGFFKSRECRRALQQFLEREKSLGRTDLILPVYYVDSPALRDQSDPLASAIGTRIYYDWRDLRLEPFTSPQVMRAIAELARRIVESLNRADREPPAAAGAGLEGMRRLLLDTKFMIAKIKRFGVDALAGDFAQLVRHRDVEVELDFPARVLEALRQNRAGIEDAPDDLPAILYTHLLNARVSREQIRAELKISSLPLVPAAPVANAVPHWPRRHGDAVTGSTLVKEPAGIATWSADGTVRIWPMRKDAPVVLPHRGAVTAFAAMGGYAVSADAEGFLCRWQLRDRLPLDRIAAHARGVNGLIFDHPRNLIVTWSGSDPIRLWTSGERIEPAGELTGHTHAVMGCLLFPNDGRLLSVSRAGTCRLWDVSERREIRMATLPATPTALEHHWERGAVVVATANRKLIVVAIAGSAFMMADIATGHELPISGIRVSPSGVLVTWSEDQTIRVRSQSAPDREVVLRGHTGAVTAVRFATSRPWLVSASADATAIAWNYGTGEIVSRLEGHLAPIRTIEIDGDTVFTAGDDRVLKTWDAEFGNEIADYSEVPRRVADCVAPSLTSDGTTILGISRNGDVAVACSRLGGTAQVVHLSSGDTNDVELAQPERGVISACTLERNRIAFGTTGGEIQFNGLRLDAHRGRISALAFVPTQTLVATSWDGTISVWSAETGALLRRIEVGPRILSFAFNGSFAATGTEDGKVVIWNIDSGARAQSFEGHTGPVTVVRMDDSFIASASPDCTVQIHALGYAWGAVCRGHSDTITGLALHDRTIYSCSEDRTIRRWSVPEGQQTGVVYGTAPFRCISASDEVVIAGDDAGNVWTLELPAKKLSVLIWSTHGDRETADRLLLQFRMRGVDVAQQFFGPLARPDRKSDAEIVIVSRNCERDLTARSSVDKAIRRQRAILYAIDDEGQRFTRTFARAKVLDGRNRPVELAVSQLLDEVRSLRR